MIFLELSNAAFRFSLRRPGAEIMGGAFKRPPPPAGGGKSRGPAGRGLTELNHKVTDQQLTELIFGIAMPTYGFGIGDDQNCIKFHQQLIKIQLRH